MIATLLLLLPAASNVPVGPPLVPPVMAPAQESTSSMHMAKTTVGMRILMRDLLLKGSKLRAKPVLDPGKADAIVRIISSHAHGTDFRYDLEVTPFVAGVLDVRGMLEREDGSSTSELPSMSLLVDEVLAKGQLEPNPLSENDPGRFGGYWDKMRFAWIAWAVGLLLILLIGWKRKQRMALAEQDGGPTLAQRLEPLVQSAQRGDLDDADRAGLERLLFAYWREKRGLEGKNVSAAMAELREDEEAGPLLKQLEVWLHSPNAGDSNVDVKALLAPYENAPDEDQSPVGSHA